MEFLRFGSSIPGGYWGCCACCIIQNFKVDPDAKASIAMVNGDAGIPVTDAKGGYVFAGPTYRDIFWQRLRAGTFDKRDMPNHAFLAILTDWQVSGGPGSIGYKWMEILKEAGFEFIRAVGNSVYSGAAQHSGDLGEGTNKNYIFGLFRNVGKGAMKDQFTPPAAWSALPSVGKVELLNAGDADPVCMTKQNFEADKAVYNNGKAKPFLTEADVIAAGAPVIMGGQRLDGAAPEEKSKRDARSKAQSSNPFGKKALAA